MSQVSFAPCDPDPLRQSILGHIRYTLARPVADATPQEFFKPVSLAIRDYVVDRLLATEQRYEDQDVKRLYYLSLELLMGRWLNDNLSNLGFDPPSQPPPPVLSTYLPD